MYLNLEFGIFKYKLGKNNLNLIGNGAHKRQQKKSP